MFEPAVLLGLGAFVVYFVLENLRTPRTHDDYLAGADDQYHCPA
jgi:hypothetical protein